MTAVRVHELAKELKLTSKELMNKAKTLKIETKSHMSVLDEKAVTAIKDSLKKKAPPPKPVPQATAHAPSIEDVKKELLLQRMGARKPAVAVSPKPAVRIEPRKAPAPPPVFRPRPHVEIRRQHHKPAPPPVQPVQAPPPPEPGQVRRLEIPTTVSVKDLAERLFIRPSDLIQRLIKLNIFATINQVLNFDVAARVLKDMGYEAVHSAVEVEAGLEAVHAQAAVDKSKWVIRAPIVTFMGHVDHGKTSLLDAIRDTKVAAGEAGGITQHIGAYQVVLPKGAVTFLDTPGHEAFTAMRARGAKATDVVVLVVAADDGVMPQTIEAIDHATAAGVPIIVAINKMDLPSANPERVKKGLSEHGLLSEEWGGKTVMIGVSAKTGDGIDELLEMLALESELLELKVDPKASPRGVVVEAELSKESGVLATVLVQEGRLHVGDTIVVGPYYCRVRAMINDRGQRVREAPPSMPVEILGLSGVPKAGDIFQVVKDERTAKEMAAKREALIKTRAEGMAGHITLEHLYEDLKAGKISELKLIIKSDVQGSVEALRSTLGKIQSKNARLNLIHSGVGEITESDVMLAAASEAVVIGFHVGVTEAAKDLAEREGVDVRFYEIIYEVKTAIEKAMEGLLEPELKEVAVGSAEVRQVFKVSKVGTIAGCAVTKGKIVRNFSCRVVREGKRIADGRIESLKRFKDDAREVLEGFECGIGVANFEELQPGDRIEVYEIQKKARKLE